MKQLLENWKRYIEEAEHFDSEDKNLNEVISSLENLVETPFIFFDTETLGLNPEFDQITQLAYSIYKNNQKVEEQNIVASLTPRSKEKFTIGTPENERFMSFLNKDKEKKLAYLEKNKSKLSPEEYERKIKDIEIRTQPDFILKLTGYDEADAQMTEKEMLITFLKSIENYENSTLCAHNILFDLKAVNTRNQKYGLPTLDENKNIITFLDTLKLSKKTYLSTLKSLLEKFKKELDELQKDVQEPKELNSMFSQMKPGLDNEFKKANISSISRDIQNATQDFTDIDKKILVLKILIKGTENALQNNEKVFSHTLGSLAKTFKINPEKAHNALEDVKMLIDVFNGMLNILKIAQRYISSEEETINEIISEIHSL